MFGLIHRWDTVRRLDQASIACEKLTRVENVQVVEICRPLSTSKDEDLAVHKRRTMSSTWWGYIAPHFWMSPLERF